MQISKGTVVSVNYLLSSSQGSEPSQLVEETSNEHPFVFLFGYNGAFPHFEKELEGKSAGDKFDFTIHAEHSYGPYEQDYVVKVDRAAFIIDGKFDETRVQVGYDVPMRDANGEEIVGHVVDITDNYVEMDFNHPLAGHDLHFNGTILDVRQASSEEIEHGHVHGTHGHHH